MTVTKSESVNNPFSSLSYQIFLAVGWWYFIVYILAECSMLVLKKYYYLYPLHNFLSELALLCFMAGIESIRIFLGKKGNLTERPFHIMLSLLLTVPITVAVLYFFLWQTYVIMVDVVICSISFFFIGFQSLFSVFTLINFGR